MSETKPKIYKASPLGITSSLIDYDAKAATARLQRFGHAAYIVGGGVRDLLLGIHPKDFDIATSASPKEIRKIFRNSRLIGRRFQIVHLFYRDRKIIEVATFRDIDREAPQLSDQAEGDEEVQKMDENVFGTESTDALRRDITINALFFDPQADSVIDYVGGVDDIRKGIVRMIGDPVTRFREDPVRMLRLIRHAARAGFAIERETHQALKPCGELLNTVAGARLYLEVTKDLTRGLSLKTLREYAAHGLLQTLLPDVADPAALQPGSLCSRLLHGVDTLARSGTPPPMTLALTALTLAREFSVKSTAELAEIIKNRNGARDAVAHGFHPLPLPRKEREKINGILTAWISCYAPEKRPIKRATLSRLPVLDELALFCQFIGRDERDVQVLEMIEEAQEAR